MSEEDLRAWWVSRAKKVTPAPRSRKPRSQRSRRLEIKSKGGATGQNGSFSFNF